MKRPFGWLIVLLLSLGWLAGPLTSSATGQTAEADSNEFFKNGKVLNLSIRVEGKELQDLLNAPRKYVKATFRDGDKNSFKDVGIHLKGAAGSYRDFNDKPGLTLNMSKFSEVDVRFHGMGKFHLANSVQDPTYLAELICGELFRAAGVPASRVGHAVVTLNGKPRGLYYLKEGYDKYFLKKHFGNRHGNLYDGGFLKELNQPLQLLSGKDDVKDQADLKKLWAAATEKDLKQRFVKMEKVLDMDKFISYLVLEVITWDWDGYPMNRNNYRIYHDPERDKIIFLPSGMDQMFANPNGPILPNFQGVVARAVLETPDGRRRYLDRLEVIMKTVFSAEKVINRLDELQAKVQPALTALNPGAGANFVHHVNNLRNAVKQREKSIQQQLKQMKK